MHKLSAVLKHQLYSIIWAGIILFLCTYPGNGIPKIRFNFIVPLDKLVHVLLFSVLAFLSVSGTATQYLGVGLRNCFKVFIWCFGYGISIELIQENFCIGRSFELVDIFADSIGAIFGICFYIILIRIRRKSDASFEVSGAKK